MAISLEHLSSGLRKATLLFLTLPLIVFFVGWLQVPFALITCLPLGTVLWRCLRPALRPVDLSVPPSGCPVSLLKLTAVTALPAAVLTLLSGAGGWGGGDSDWLKHDTLLRDLIARPWPVTYETAHGSVLLVYYLTFYVPAALLGKLAGGAGLFVGGQVLALTTFAGTVFSALWLIVLGVPQRPAVDNEPNPASRVSASVPCWIGAAVFFGFSGLDALGKALVNHSLKLPALDGNWYDIEWWAQFAQYSSNAATLFWAPQHAFGGWLPLALALDDWLFHPRRLEDSWMLYIALALVWSPFAAVGLSALLGGLWFCRRIRASPSENTLGSVLPTRDLLRRSLTLANGAGALSGGFFLLFLSAHFQSYYLPEAYRVTPGYLPMPLLEQHHISRLALYLLFVGIEFAGLSLALTLFFRRGKGGSPSEDAGGAERTLLLAATLVLLVLPWFHYGFANDLVMRGAIPALFGLQVLLVRMFALASSAASRGATPVGRQILSRRIAVAAAALLLAGGLVNVGIEYGRHVVRISRQGSWRDARTREPVQTLAELQRTIYARPGFDFARQYLGSNDSFFARHLARQKPPPPALAQKETDF